jgi:hypothetical protein
MDINRSKVTEFLKDDTLLQEWKGWSIEDVTIHCYKQYFLLKDKVCVNCDKVYIFKHNTIYLVETFNKCTRKSFLLICEWLEKNVFEEYVLPTTNCKKLFQEFLKNNNID